MMKKYIFILIILLYISGCSSIDKSSQNNDLKQFQEMKEMGITYNQYQEYKSMDMSKQEYLEYLEQKDMKITKEQYEEYNKLGISKQEYLELLKFREINEKGISEEKYEELKFIEEYNLTDDEYKIYQQSYLKLGRTKEDFIKYLFELRENQREIEKFELNSKNYNLSITGSNLRITLLKAGYFYDIWMPADYYRAEFKVEGIGNNPSLYLTDDNSEIYGDFKDHKGLDNQYKITTEHFKLNNTRYVTLYFINAKEDIQVNAIDINGFFFDLENNTAYFK